MLISWALGTGFNFGSFDLLSPQDGPFPWACPAGPPSRKVTELTRSQHAGTIKYEQSKNAGLPRVGIEENIHLALKTTIRFYGSLRTMDD
jgi:hypothetical protein